MIVTCFFLRARCQIRQHMFSNLELRSLVLRVATTLIHVRWRSDSSTLDTTSSTKYCVGLKCPLSGGVTAFCICSSTVPAPVPVDSIASRYPLIHSLPAIRIYIYKVSFVLLSIYMCNTGAVQCCLQTHLKTLVRTWRISWILRGNSLTWPSTCLCNEEAEYAIELRCKRLFGCVGKKSMSGNFIRHVEEERKKEKEMEKKRTWPHGRHGMVGPAYSSFVCSYLCVLPCLVWFMICTH